MINLSPIDTLTCIESKKTDRIILSNNTKKYIAHQVNKNNFVIFKFLD